MKTLILFASLWLIPIPAFAHHEICYRVSPDGKAWSNTPELLCVGQAATGLNEYQITLRSGMPPQQKTIADFNLSLVSSARCPDCNHNLYAVENPANSTFNALAIRFHGKRDLHTGKETGIVRIGSNLLHYSSEN